MKPHAKAFLYAVVITACLLGVCYALAVAPSEDIRRVVRAVAPALPLFSCVYLLCYLLIEGTTPPPSGKGVK